MGKEGGEGENHNTSGPPLRASFQALIYAQCGMQSHPVYVLCCNTSVKCQMETSTLIL